MASQSPTESAIDGEGDAHTSQTEYLDAWRKITRLMDSGSSWSGRERNCAFLNLGQREFVDISAAAGLDHLQDGRAVANFDWDGDGDLDLWLKSRNGRQLRLLENNRAGEPTFLGLRLRGTTCNRDAIGARAILVAGGQSYTREVRCGEGYLAQSTSELLFGLPSAAELESVTVHWPGGAAEVFEGVTLGAHCALVQGEGVARVLPRREIKLKSDARLPQLPPSARVVLRTPLPLPSALLRKYCDPNKPGARLLTFWATWCEPCLQDLGLLARNYGELAAGGLEVLPMCLDAREDPEAAHRLFEGRAATQFAQGPAFSSRDLDAEEQSFFEVLFAHLLAPSGALSVPASLLVDKNGMLEVLYLGALEVDVLAEDVASYGLSPQSIGVRSSYPGRWFYGMPRNLDQLSTRLRERQLGAAASYYSALHNMAQRRSQ